MTDARALRVTRPGGPEVLAVERVEVPSPGPGQVRVRVQACGINFIDVYQREGIYPVPTPFTPGVEGAGIVEAVGPDTDAPAVGTRVAQAMTLGFAAELALAPAAVLVPVPDEITSEQAAAAMLQGMTAHFLTTSTYAVQPGDAVLVHAAAGGVGQWLVQLCVAAGATVIATAGSPEKLAIARSLGASHTIDYTAYERPEQLAAAVREATGGTGVAVAYDGVGRSTFDASLASLRRRGLVVLFGGASGQVPPLDLQRLNAAGSVFVTRPTLAHHIADREELLWRAAAVFEAIALGRVRMQIGATYPLEEAAAAYRVLQGRQSTGKLVFQTAPASA
ncbi:MAG: quinone oxidoreductase [Candidatus Phosphoribacter sp.]|nr:quinone oxidoreductase [Actinomycetales bacterium]